MTKRYETPNDGARKCDVPRHRKPVPTAGWVFTFLTIENGTTYQGTLYVCDVCRGDMPMKGQKFEGREVVQREFRRIK